MRLNFPWLGLTLILSLIVSVGSVDAAMTSTNYQINWDTISVGGDDTSSSASYLLRDSIGNQGSGNSASTTYSLNGGYRAGVYDRTADFTIYLQDRSSQVAASLATSTTVTVTTVSSFSVGDYIALVQDQGGSQVSAVGKITSISTPIITVDSWTYSASLPAPNGADDYVYLLNSSSLSLGTLVPGNISTALIAWEVSADVSDGFSVYFYENQDLTSGTNTIDDVSDGNVNGVQDEYGARSSDTSLALSTFDTEDTAITSTAQQVASESDNSFSVRGFVTLMATVDGTVAGGTYTQELNLMYVGDY